MPWAAKLYKELWQKLGPQSKWLTQELHVVVLFLHIVEPFWVGKGPKHRKIPREGSRVWWHEKDTRSQGESRLYYLPAGWTWTNPSTPLSLTLKESEKCQSLSRVWLCNPMNCSPLGSSVYGILQPRILEWVAISSSRGSSGPRIETASPVAPALQADSLSYEPPGKQQSHFPHQ